MEAWGNIHGRTGARATKDLLTGQCSALLRSAAELTSFHPSYVYAYPPFRLHGYPVRCLMHVSTMEFEIRIACMESPKTRDEPVENPAREVGMDRKRRLEAVRSASSPGG